jgi:predicted nuclease of predicted toxin-antitoxin system
MKLLLDEGLPFRAAAALRDAGVDAEHVLEIGMGGAADQAVLDRARQDGAVLVTLDADFHQILAATGAGHPSVIRVRIEGLQAGQLASLVLETCRLAERELRNGAAVSLVGNRMRIRRLPIRSRE